jgi:hypothetical protein
LGSNITIPYKYDPYPHQIEIFKARDQDKKHILARWSRRTGKDKTFWNLVIREAVKRRGIYYYFFPQLKQGKKALWEGMDNEGFKFLDHIPPELRDGEPNSTEMKVPLSNGSLIQIIGTDNYDRVRGTNPVGCIFSEYAYQNPGARATVRPILLANNGWEALNSTPNGKNHMYHLEMDNKDNPNWFISVKTMEDCFRHDGSQVFTNEMLEEERKQGYSEEFLQQEYYVSYTANAQGYYFLKYMNDLREVNRIGDFPWIPDAPVYTYWDIGRDTTAIWFQQWDDNFEPRIIDFYRNSSLGLDHYGHIVLNKPYAYKGHFFPHDMWVSEWTNSRTRIEVAENLFGTENCMVVPKVSFEDGIQAVRSILPRCKFNETPETKLGINALENYKRKYNEALQEFSYEPVHDWASHPADAFRYFAVSAEAPKPKDYIQRRLRQYRRSFKQNWMMA